MDAFDFEAWVDCNCEREIPLLPTAWNADEDEKNPENPLEDVDDGG